LTDIMQQRRNIRALIPVKNFGDAKKRLRDALCAEDCSALAACMARDVVTAAMSAGSVDGVTLLGGGDAVSVLASEMGCDFKDEYYDADLSANLNIAAHELEADGVSTLLVMPADLPTLLPGDIDALLARSIAGVSVCRAGRDGGTNALVVTPPTTIQFYFGEQSAKRHLDAARDAGVAVNELTSPAFTVDIDTPADLVWLCQQALSGHTADFLDDTGIRGKILNLPGALTG
jgi:2-phospho-L-lactate guanylyltransferase